jgi:hypothetical protein
MTKEKAPQRVKLELEYPLRSSANILYQYISNPSGLQSWFADHVEVKQNKYTFRWNDGSETLANVLKNVTNKYIKFAIVNAPTEDEFLEFRISQDAITDDVELIITEFVNEDEEEVSASLWDSAVDNLRHIIGA